MTSQPPEVLEGDHGAVPLPAVGLSGRKRRRRELAKARRRRHTALAAAGVVAVLFVAALLVGTGGPGGGKSPAAQAPRVDAVDPAILVVAGAKGEAKSVTVLVPAADKGGTLVFVPPGTMTEIASLGVEPISLSLELGGAQRLASTLENVLGATIGSVQVVDDDGMAALVERAGQLEIDIPDRVETVETNGQVNIVFESGPTVVQPEDVPVLLDAKGSASDLSRLARHQAFWNAWIERMAEDPSTVPAADAGVRKAMAALATGTVSAQILPVSSMGVAESGQELYRVEKEQTEDMVLATFPNAAHRGTRPTVQILNGTGEIQLAQRVADVLVPKGVEVKLTGNAASFAHQQTQIVFYDQKKRAAAEKVQKALGVGRLVLSRRPLDVVDVTVIVGKDFKD